MFKLQDAISLFEACLVFVKEVLSITGDLYHTRNRKGTIQENSVRWLIPHDLPLEERPRKNPDLKYSDEEDIIYGDPDDPLSYDVVQEHWISPLNLHVFSHMTVKIMPLKIAIFLF